MFDHLPSCQETVALWYALLFETGDACVSINPWTVLQVVILFALAAYVLQAAVNRLVFGRRTNAADEDEAPRTKTGQRMSKRGSDRFEGGPIA